MTAKVVHEPAFVLHRYDWSESSVILDAFTRHHGRVALVAKGAKKPSSNLRPVLLPMQLLQISYSGDGDIRTLKYAQWMGGHTMPSGAALLSGYYLNELLMRLLPRDDPHALLFDVYAQAIADLTRTPLSGNADTASLSLRAFELVLLRESGVLPDLNLQTQNLQALQPDRWYHLLPHAGLCPVQEDVDPTVERVLDAHSPQHTAMPGQWWLALQSALDHVLTDWTGLLSICSKGAYPLKMQLRHLLQHHNGQHMLRTRQLMADLQKL